MLEKTFNLSTLFATETLAREIANAIVPGFVITLRGDLGAGKTTLTRYILQNMGIKGPIKSPTFTLVEPYIAKIMDSRKHWNDNDPDENDVAIYHFDLYRFNDPEEWFYAGFDEYFSDSSICFIEWADKASTLIPNVDWQLNFTLNQHHSEVRILSIAAISKKGEMCLKKLI